MMLRYLSEKASLGLGIMVVAEQPGLMLEVCCVMSLTHAGKASNPLGIPAHRAIGAAPRRYHRQTC